MKRSLFVLLLISCLASCTSTDLKELDSKKEYLEKRKQLDFADLKEQLKKDAAAVQSLIDTCDGIYLTYSFSMGLSGSKPKEEVIDSAAAFQFENKDSLLKDFNRDDRKLLFQQELRIPEPGFQFFTDYSGDKNNAGAVNDEVIEYRMEQLFYKDKEMKLADLQLRQADSILVNAIYRFPTGFDTLKIPEHAKGPLNFKDELLEVDTTGKNFAEFTMPVALHAKVLDKRGVTPSGVLVGSNAYSANPLRGLNPDISTAFKQFIGLANEAARQPDKEKAIQFISSIPETTFDAVKQVRLFVKDAYSLIKGMKRLDKEEKGSLEETKAFIKKIQDIEEKYAGVWTITKMQYEIEFPYEIKEIQLYIGGNYDSVSRKFMAKNSLDSSAAFFVFENTAAHKFGITDRDGNRIISAQYDQLERNGDHFFTEYKKTGKLLYLLNNGSKTLEKVPGNRAYIGKLNDKLFEFEEKNNQIGIADAALNEIIPFEYEGAELVENTIIMRGAYRGRKFYDFYQLNGNRIKTPEKITEYERHGKKIVIFSRDKVAGMIHEDGRVEMPVDHKIIEDLLYQTQD